MAQTFQIDPPDAFCFSKPNEWPKWIRRFEHVRSASALDEKADAVQVNTLIYVTGDEEDNTMAGFGLTRQAAMLTLYERGSRTNLASRNRRRKLSLRQHQPESVTIVGDIRLIRSVPASRRHHAIITVVAPPPEQMMTHQQIRSSFCTGRTEPALSAAQVCLYGIKRSLLPLTPCPQIHFHK